MENPTKNKYRPVLIFLSITFALSSIFYFLIIYSGKISGGVGQYGMALMWCPGISAFITMKILKRNISDLGWKWGKTKYQVWSYFIPFFYTLIAYVIVWSVGWGGFYNKEGVINLTKSFGLGEIGDGTIIVLTFLFLGVFGIISSMASALGEEIGWRGFLVPELYKNLGYTKTAFITGVIWVVWHTPVLLFADYNSGTPGWYALSCFAILTVSAVFIYTWLRIKSGSLWTGVILHASHNLFIQSLFTPFTVDTGNTAYFIDEFGIVLPIVVAGFAIYFWTKRKELKPVPNTV